MLKRITSIPLILCVLFICIYPNVSDAGRDYATGWGNAREYVYNAESLVETDRDRYHIIRGDLQTLLNDWENNKNAVKRNKEVTLIAAGGAIVSACVAIATGGSLIPASYVAIVTAYKNLVSTETTTKKSEEYLTAMSTLVELLDIAKINVKAAYNGGDRHVAGNPNTQHTVGYDKQYTAYLQMAVGHGLDGYSTVEALAASVKGTPPDPQNGIPGSEGTLSGYYHSSRSDAPQGKQSDSHEDHVFARYMYYEDFNVLPDLPNVYPCEGIRFRKACTDLFRTPYEALTVHRKICGTAMNADVLSAESCSPGGKFPRPAYLPDRCMSVQEILDSRTVAEGCGRDYYDCPSDRDTEHQVQRCELYVWEKPSGYLNYFESYKCQQKFRECMGHTRDHHPGIPGHARHSSSEVSEPTAEATATPTPSEATDNTPNCDNCTDGCSSCPITCDIQGCTLQTPYNPSDTAAALHEYCAQCCMYKCDGANHTQTYCYATDSNGNTCTVGNYWACVTHTHQFPATNLCPAAGCNERITSTNAAAHARVTCTGSTHQSCNQSYYACEAGDHRWVYCLRNDCPIFFHKGWRYRIRRCSLSNNQYSCITINGTRRQHTLSIE